MRRNIYNRLGRKERHRRKNEIKYKDRETKTLTEGKIRKKGGNREVKT